jgi:hypothetical protein
VDADVQKQRLELEDGEDTLVAEVQAGLNPTIRVNSEEFQLGLSEIRMLLGFLKGCQP